MGNQTQFELYYRYMQTYLQRQFVLSNQNGNLQDKYGYNNTIVSMEYLYDKLLEQHIIYLITKPVKPTVDYLSLHSIYFNNRGLQNITDLPLVLNITKTQNCGDIIKAHQNLLVIACSSNGALQAFVRNRTLEQVELSSAVLTIPSQQQELNQQIAVIEHIADNGNFTDIFLFATYRPSKTKRARMVAYEILIDSILEPKKQKQVLVVKLNLTN